jgi:hypothetical protein
VALRCGRFRRAGCVAGRAVRFGSCFVVLLMFSVQCSVFNGCSVLLGSNQQPTSDTNLPFPPRSHTLFCLSPPSPDHLRRLFTKPSPSINVSQTNPLGFGSHSVLQILFWTKENDGALHLPDRLLNKEFAIAFWARQWIRVQLFDGNYADYLTKSPDCQRRMPVSSNKKSWLRNWRGCASNQIRDD